MELLQSLDANSLIKRYTNTQPYSNGLKATVRKVHTTPAFSTRRQAVVAHGPSTRTAM